MRARRGVTGYPTLELSDLALGLALRALLKAWLAAGSRPAFLSRAKLSVARLPSRARASGPLKCHHDATIDSPSPCRDHPARGSSRRNRRRPPILCGGVLFSNDRPADPFQRRSDLHDRHQGYSAGYYYSAHHTAAQWSARARTSDRCAVADLRVLERHDAFRALFIASNHYWRGLFP